MKRPRSKRFCFRKLQSEEQEIHLLNSWIEFGKPDRGVDPKSFPPLPSDAPIGRIRANSFSPYVGCHKFSQLPISQKTKDGLTEAKYTKMTEIQRASLPHSLCGRDISGSAKTGSGKTLAFIIPVLEKLYRERWGPEDGVGCIIISPTRELAGQTFEVLNSVGKYHSFSAGLLIGGRKDVESEKECANRLNILICTPGRLLQHMNETPNFDCTQLQVLVLDEADRVLDAAFANDLDLIISQLPKSRQTLLFSATQTKSIKDLERLSLKDAEYVNVHKEAVTATPSRLQQTAIIVPLDQKLDMLWSFIKAHLNSRILVFLSSCKQVKFVFEVFKKLRPGIPLKCLHGRMKQERRMGIYYQFCEQRSVLFSTDVASRGLDFNKGVDWVVQVDCPEDFKAYIHRVGRTARFHSVGRSVLFLSPSEMKMLEKLQEQNIPIRFTKANTKRLQTISGLLAALLVKHPDLQSLAQRAFITYLKSIYKQKDKEVFDLMKLSIDEFSASLGLPMTPKVRFLKQRTKGKTVSEGSTVPSRNPIVDNMLELPPENPGVGMFEEEKVEKGFPLLKGTSGEQRGIMSEIADMPSTRVLNKKLKINIHRPVGKRVVFDEDGNTMPPLAKFADREGGTDTVGLDDRVSKRYAEMREELKEEDKVDKLLDRQRRKEKRIKDKLKLKRGRKEDEEDVLNGDDLSGSVDEGRCDRSNKRSKVKFGSDSDDGVRNGDKGKVDLNTDLISLREQEELALKLLSSMHS